MGTSTGEAFEPPADPGLRIATYTGAASEDKLKMLASGVATESADAKRQTSAEA